MSRKPFVYFDDIPIFASLGQEEAKELTETVIRKRFRRGRVLQLEGQPADFFAVLVRGSAKAVLVRPDGGEVLLHFYNPGDFFGESNVLEGISSPHSIEVTEDAEFLFFSASMIASAMRKNGSFALDLFGWQCQQLGRVQKRLRDVLYERGDGRILRYFQDLADQVGTQTEEGVLIQEQVSHQAIADTCGLARETVSRLLGQLNRRGKLKRTKQGWILNTPQPTAS